MVASHEVGDLLRDAHLPGALSDDEQRVLAGLILGLRPKEIADALFRGPRGVQQTVAKLGDLVCLPVGLEHRSPAVVGWWFALHSACDRGCAARALEIIEAGEIPLPRGRGR